MAIFRLHVDFPNGQSLKYDIEARDPNRARVLLAERLNEQHIVTKIKALK